MQHILWGYLILINSITFLLFAIDKWKAVHGKWRISEAALLGFSLVGGAVGGLLAMFIFRHKTRKKRFTVSLPLMMLAQAAVMVWILRC